MHVISRTCIGWREAIDDHAPPLVEKIWDYHQPRSSAGRPRMRFSSSAVTTRSVARRGAELFLEGWAPLLIFAGGLGAITRHLWHEPEADQFAAIAIEMGVPPERILIENRSTNTGENVLFTKRLLAEKGLDPQHLHRRAEAVHGAPELCDVQEGLAGKGSAA